MDTNRWSSSSWMSDKPEVCRKCRSTDVDIINAYSDSILIDQWIHCNQCQHGESLGDISRSKNKEDGNE